MTRIYYDTNKNWINDSELCWAASIANAIHYTGWSRVLNFIDNEDIMNYYRNIGNYGSYEYIELRKLFIERGAEMYFNNTVHSRSPHDLFMCKELFESGGAAILWIEDENRSGSHAIAAYEITCNQMKHPKFPTYILHVDSDDNLTKTYNARISYNYSKHRYEFNSHVLPYYDTHYIYGWTSIEKCNV